ncbi:polysaccharide deacetylase family protein [Paenibacillus arenilitoris]|uniref:Polysaccharide deacetylase family protein n=1 Tax=Paenibacillus arenilitoris TaxID=2772299 RepID=A0A927CKB8_9BACL|nr:polysaccharide deacetylase family protein [Paenibacillus arenilitoris]MBD2869624.1 polysaccharide deacetylase family protein [Paenibacillus arenilitoris]
MIKSCSLVLALLLTGISLAACGGEAADGERGAPIAVPADATPAATTPAPAGTESPTGADASIEPDQAAEVAPRTNRYRMTDAFRFVPTEEGIAEKAVLLTFDDGPKDEAVLRSMLDTLDKHKAKAIFFVNGYRVKQNPELLKLIHEREHAIGNHSWDHIDLKKESEETVERQIGDLQAEVESLIGEKPLFFRPPYGSGGDVVRRIAKNHGMLYMTWSNGSLDWDRSARDKPEEVIRNVLEQLHPGANILMHELPWTADALDELLTRLTGKGYAFIDPGEIEVDVTR